MSSQVPSPAPKILTSDEIEKAIADSGQNLFDALVRSARLYGKKHIILEDSEGNRLSYKDLILASLVLGRKFVPMTDPEYPVGVMLPNVTGAAVTIFALAAWGRVPAMLNFTAGLKNVTACMRAATCEHIITSRRFVRKAGLEDLVKGLEKAGFHFIYLEDVRKTISPADKARGLLSSLRLSHHIRQHTEPSEEPAVVLFTSGSEGVPKGVVLTHRNLLANVWQISRATDFYSTDRIFNALPVFHSFGLTAALLLPTLHGMSCYLYPTPLHYKQIPDLIHKQKATVIFGTDTFLFGYARYGNAEHLKGLRLVIAGAEKLKERTRKLWKEKVGTQIYEGYGVTETAPVLAVNVPGRHQPGSVGMPLEGMKCRLEPVPGLEKGGVLHVHGPNVMAGYLLADEPGVLHELPDGWHNTGDIVEMNEGNFITIIGRAKRFAKIGGEMVSLAAVEEFAAKIWPDNRHVAVARNDERKGEQIILVTDRQQADRQELVKAAQAAGLAEIMLPRALLKVKEIPVLGTGKIDFASAARLVNETDNTNLNKG